mgnify:CR=1 FL=1
MEDKELTKNGNVKIVQTENERESITGGEIDEGDIALVIKGIFTSNSPIMGNKEKKNYIKIENIDDIVEALKNLDDGTKKIGLTTITKLDKNPVDGTCSVCEGAATETVYMLKKNNVESLTVHEECLSKLADIIEEGMEDNKKFVVAGKL